MALSTNGDTRCEDYSSFVPPKSRRIDSNNIDNRTDEEISQELRSYSPVTSHYNVWAVWHSGFDGMPGWCQRNVVDWVRRSGNKWTVRVVARDPGLHTDVFNYVSPELFPDIFRQNGFTGKAVKQKMSNMMRLVLLYVHGGVYVDVSIILCRTFESICFRQLEDPSTSWKLAVMKMQSRPGCGQVMNSFIAALPKDPFIKNWHHIYCALWTDRTSQDGLHAHPLLRHLPLLEFPTEENWTSPFSATEWSDYSAHMLCCQRLIQLHDPNGFDGATYFRDNILLIDALSEMFHGQEIGDDAVFELLTLPFRPSSANSLQQRAAETLSAMLFQSSIIKFGEGYWMEGLPVPVAKRFREYVGSDCNPGTWAGWLRWACTHLEQDVPSDWNTPRAEPSSSQTDSVVTAGLLEPVLRTS